MLYGFTRLHTAAFNGRTNDALKFIAEGDPVLLKAARGFDAAGLAFLGGHPDLGLHLLRLAPGGSSCISFFELLPMEKDELKRYE